MNIPMILPRRNFIKIASLTALLSSKDVWAKYPDHPIHLIVPLAVGGNGDNMARLTQPLMASQLGQPLVIENRGGAGGSLGTEIASHAQADGYTLLWGSNGSLVNSPLMQKVPRYNPLKDFQSIGLMSMVPMVLVLRKGLPINNLKEFIAYGASNGGAGLSIGTSGVGGSNHIPLELFKKATNAKILHVPYRGGGSALPDLLGGNVDGLFTEVSTVLDMHNTGQARIIGIASSQRSPLIPEVETFIDFGLNNFTAFTFNGLWATSPAPADCINQLQSALAYALKNQQLIANVTKHGGLIAPVELQTPLGAQKFLEKEINTTILAMKIANIEPE